MDHPVCGGTTVGASVTAGLLSTFGCGAESDTSYKISPSAADARGDVDVSTVTDTGVDSTPRVDTDTNNDSESPLPDAYSKDFDTRDDSVTAGISDELCPRSFREVEAITESQLTVDPAWEAVYVNEGALVPGDGERNAPFASLAEAVAAAPSDEAIVMLGPGTYEWPNDLEHPLQLAIVGTCAADTRLTARADDAPGVDLESIESISLSHLALEGGRLALAASDIERLEVARTAITGTDEVGVELTDVLAGQIRTSRLHDFAELAWAGIRLEASGGFCC